MSVNPELRAFFKAFAGILYHIGRLEKQTDLAFGHDVFYSDSCCNLTRNNYFGKYFVGAWSLVSCDSRPEASFSLVFSIPAKRTWCWSWKFKRKGLLCSQNLHTESKTNCHKCNFKSLNIHSWLWTPTHIGTLFLLVVWNGQELGEYNWHEEERFLKKFPSSAVTRSRLKWFRKRTSARGPEQSLFKGSIAPRIHQLTNIQEKMCLVRY